MCSKNILKILTFLSPITNNDGSYKKKQKFKKIIQQHPGPGVPLTYFNDGAGGGGDPSDFWGSEILAKSDFLWFYERHRDFIGLQKNRDFLGCKKRTKGFF